MNSLLKDRSEHFRESPYGLTVNSNPSSFATTNGWDRVPIYTLFIAYFIYQLQGAVYTSGGIVSQTLLFLVIAIDLVYFLKSLLFRKQSGFYYIWTGFFLLNVLGFFLWGGNLSKSEHFSMFKGIVLCLATFYPAYYLARKGSLRRKDLLVFFVLGIIAAIVSFFYVASKLSSEYGLNEETIVNNMAYNFVFLTPFLFLIKRKNLSYILLFVLMFFVIQGAKRGAIVVELVLVLLYFYHEITNIKHNKGALKSVLLVLVGLSLMGYAVYEVATSNEFLVMRFESTIKGDSSGRDYLYRSIWNSWWNESSNDWITFLFGFGFASSMQLTGGLFAHNDWLEVLSNFGLMGIILYFSLIVKGFAYTLCKSWTEREDRMLLLTIMTAWLLISFFSMWYTNLEVLTQTILLGYLMGKNVNTHNFAHV